MPTHRYPTSESMHLSYSFGIVKSSSNFVESKETAPLTDEASLRIFQHRLTGELQPSRQLSIGAILDFDQMKLGDHTSELSVSKAALGDQRIWGEYRFYDTVGTSLGIGTMVKFPAYKNPDAGEGSVALLGDAQTDFTAMITGEHWINKNFRLRGDFGATFRTEGNAGELPFLFAAGYVTNKIDLDFRVRGNLSLNNDAIAGGETTEGGLEELRQAFAGSYYALASNPWVIALNPAIEIWTSNKNGFTFEYLYSLMGKNSPHYHYFGFGWTMRWARNKITRPKTFQQVDISTQQDPDQFQGEMGDRDAEPQPDDDDEIKEER